MKPYLLNTGPTWQQYMDCYMTRQELSLCAALGTGPLNWPQRCLDLLGEERMDFDYEVAPGARREMVRAA
jgi:hypothetical protein